MYIVNYNTYLKYNRIKIRETDNNKQILVVPKRTPKI